MNLTVWHYIGVAILSLDIIWIVFYYYYATVKIYNFKEAKQYYYLGYLWVWKRRGEYYLKIPQEMIEKSLTTRYKITSQSLFHKLRKDEKIYINFADKYHAEAKIAGQVIVDNYLEISNQL